MTKKNYIAFAKSIGEIPNYQERAQAAMQIAKVCKADNPRFDYGRFYIACGLQTKDGRILKETSTT